MFVVMVPPEGIALQSSPPSKLCLCSVPLAQVTQRSTVLLSEADWKTAIVIYGGWACS